jgi:uncharacterized membrane protein SpoIIM required for sporulation
VSGAERMMEPLVNATRFRAAHQEDWARLDDLVTRMEKKSIRSLSDEDLIALPLLYRTSLSSLSVARDTSLDRALVHYLEQLCTRAYFQIYGVQASARSQIARFFTHSWPQSVQALWRETLVCVLLTIASAIVAYLLVRSDPAWFFGIIPEGLAGGRDPSATADFLRSTLYDRHQDALAVFATYLFTHNSQIAIFAFALGFAFAAPTILLILYNGMMLGAFVAVFAAKGLGLNMTCWLMIHGTTELFAINLAGAAGIRIGMAIAFPGPLTRSQSLVKAGQSSAIAMIGVVLMLSVAGLLEGIGRQTIVGDLNRAAIGGFMLAAWLAYFYSPRRSNGADA